MWSTWVYRVMHNTCINHGEDIKTQDVGSTSILCKKIVPFPGDQNTFLSCESTNFNGGDETIHDRTGKPVVGRGASHEPGNDQAMLNEVDTDFRIPGLPHSVVKQAQNSRCSWVGQEDREPPSPTCSSTRSTTKKPTNRSVRCQSKWFRTWAT